MMDPFSFSGAAASLVLVAGLLEAAAYFQPALFSPLCIAGAVLIALLLLIGQRS